MILELCPGGELAHYLSYFGRFTVSMAKFYAREIGSGLAYLHSRNILHNDLKAENVLLTQMGHVRITDFGTSKIIKGFLRNIIHRIIIVCEILKLLKIKF